MINQTPNQFYQSGQIASGINNVGNGYCELDQNVSSHEENASWNQKVVNISSQENAISKQQADGSGQLKEYTLYPLYDRAISDLHNSDQSRINLDDIMEVLESDVEPVAAWSEEGSSVSSLATMGNMPQSDSEVILSPEKTLIDILDSAQKNNSVAEARGVIENPQNRLGSVAYSASLNSENMTTEENNAFDTDGLQIELQGSVRESQPPYRKVFIKEQPSKQPEHTISSTETSGHLSVTAQKQLEDCTNLNFQTDNTDNQTSALEGLRARHEAELLSYKKYRISKAKTKGKGIHKHLLYQFLLESIYNNSHYIEWDDAENKVFRIRDSKALSNAWGELKSNKNMKYSTLARSLRCYIFDGLLFKVPKKRLRFRFNMKNPCITECQKYCPSFFPGR